MIEKQIFIGGCPRSGTTMLGSMISVGDLCFTTPESLFKHRLFEKYGKEVFNMSVPDIVDFLLEDSGIQKIWKIDVDRVFLSNAKNIQELFFRLLKEYKNSKSLDAKNIWIDHTPKNMNHMYYLNRIFTNSKFVHIVRDGRAIYSSLKNHDWGPNTAVYAANWWQRNLVYGMTIKSLFPKDTYLISYEKLVENPELELANLCKFLGIDYSKGMIVGDDSWLPEFTKYQHDLVGKKPDKERLSSWKGKLSNREIEIFESVSGDALELLGYELLTNGKLKASKFESIYLSIKESFLQRVNTRIKMKRREIYKK